MSPNFVMCRVDRDELELQFQVQEARAGLCLDSLPDPSKTRRLRPDDTDIEKISPAGRLGKQPPHDVDGRIDHCRWTTRIGHFSHPSMRWRRSEDYAVLVQSHRMS
jgi:hypothetical protein